MGRFINPFTDVGFKRIFGQEMSKPILIEFLNSLLVGERKIVDLKYLDKEQLGLSELERSLIYDIYCETETGEHIIVEMQNKYQYSFKNRSIYYVARSIVEQGQRGRQWNYDVKAVYLVAFMNFMQAEIASKFRTDVVLMDMEERTQFSDKVRLVYLQLPYFNKEAEDCKTTFDRMIYVLKNMDILERMPWAAQDSVFQKLASIAEVAALDKEERFRYDENIRAFRDNHVIMETQRMEGRKEGHEKAQQTIARNLKQMGLSLEDISKATGLTIEEIENMSFTNILKTTIMKKIFTLISMAFVAMSMNAQEAEVWDACSIKDLSLEKKTEVLAEAIVTTENNAKNVVFRSSESPLAYPGDDMATDPATVEADGKSTDKLYNYTITAKTANMTLNAICTPNLAETQSWGYGLGVDPEAAEITNNRCLNTEACSPKFLDYMKAKSGNCTEAYIDWYEYNSDGDATHKVYQPKWNPEATDVKPAMGSWFEFTPAVAGKLKVGILLPKNIQNNKLYIATLAEDNYHYTLLDPSNVDVWGWVNNNTYPEDNENCIRNAKLQSDYRIVEATNLSNPFLGYVTFNVEANKTYMMLTPDNQLGLYGYEFTPGGESAISTVKVAENANAPMYNLAGQQVNNGFKGMMIQNGRKFMVK